MVEYYEDVTVGDHGRLGTYQMGEQEIKDFAGQYDPLPIHVDDEVAERSGHEGVIASGFHTFSAANRVVTDEFKSNLAVVAGLGIDELRWHRPVRPGDTLAVSLEVTEKRRSESNPGQGIYRLRVTARNRNGDDVISFFDTGLVEVRGVAEE